MNNIQQIQINSIQELKNKQTYSILKLLYYKKLSDILWTTVFSKNNIFSTIYATCSHLSLTKSAGNIGISNKRTSNIVYRYIIKVFSLLLFCSNKTQYITIMFRDRLVPWKKKQIIKTIRQLQIPILKIYNFSTISHGGTKKRKKRRL